MRSRSDQPPSPPVPAARRTACRLAAAALAAAVGAAAAQDAAPDERGLYQLWQRLAEGRDSHDVLAREALAFASRPGGDPLELVGYGLAGWHFLKAGLRAEGASALHAQEQAAAAVRGGGPALGPCAQRMARALLTRLDRERIEEALRAYYARHVEFPKTLEELTPAPGDPPLPKADRWGKSWAYRLEPFRTLKGLDAQHYELRSDLLGRHSDLDAFLQIPYASRIVLAPVDPVAGSAGAGTFAFTREGAPQERIHLTVGGESGGAILAYAGPGVLVLCDGDHWKVLPRPRSASHG